MVFIMLKKSLLLTGCLVVGVIFNSVSYGFDDIDGAIARPKPALKKVKLKSQLPNDPSQNTLYRYWNPKREWEMKMDAEGAKFEAGRKRAYAIQQAQKRAVQNNNMS